MTRNADVRPWIVEDWDGKLVATFKSRERAISYLKKADKAAGRSTGTLRYQAGLYTIR